MNASRPAGLPARVADVLTSFDLDELDAVLAEDGAVAALDEADAIREAAASCVHPWMRSDDERSIGARVEFVRRLIRAGLDLNQTSAGPSPLEAVISMVPVPHNLDLVREMIAAGADPNVRSPTDPDNRLSALDCAVTWDELWALLEPHANDEGLCGALVQLILRAGDPASVRFMELLARLPSIDVAVPGRLPPLHAAALSGNVDLLRVVLAHAGDRDFPLVERHEIAISETSPPGGGFAAKIELVAGMTPLDAVQAAQSLLNRKIAQYRAADHDYGHELRTRHLTGLTACREELVRAGAGSSGIVPPRAADKPFRALIDRQLRRLAELQGRDLAELQAALDLIDVSGPEKMGAYGYLKEVVRTVRPPLTQGRFEDDLGPLRFILAEDPFEHANGYPDFEDPDDDSPYRLDFYPTEYHDALLAGVAIAAQYADVFLLWPYGDAQPGVARVCHARPDGFSILGDSVEDFLEREITALSRRAVT